MGDFQNKAEELGGKAKESFGDATNNDKLEAEGKADQGKANVKQTLEDAGDKVKEAADKVVGSFRKDEDK